MRFIFLIFFLILSSSISAQSLIIETEKMSTGDANTPLSIIGNTSFYEIACISTDGIVYTYDGRRLKEWGVKKLSNIQFFDNIYISDSLLYVEIDNKFYQFEKNSNFPIKISKKTAKINTPFPWHHPYKNNSNSFSISQNTLSWTNNSLNINTSTHVNSSSQPITSAWGKPYFLINNALHSATPNPLSYDKDFLRQNNQTPQNSFNNHNLLSYVYKSSIYFPKYSQSILFPQDVSSPENIINILPLSAPINTKLLTFMIFSSNKAYLYKNNQWTSISHSITPDQATAFSIFNDQIIISTISDGIYTCPFSDNQSTSLTLLPHKLNRKLSEFNFINSLTINKTLYFFTKDNGAFSIEDNLLKIIKSPTSISAALAYLEDFYIISPKGELLTFDDSSKRISKRKNHIPSYNQSSFSVDDSNIFYTHSDSLFTYSVAKNKHTHSIPFKIPLENSFIKDKRLYSFVNQDRYATYPSLINHSKAPELHQAFITTSSDKTYQIYPNKSIINLTTDDYPLTFWAKATFLENPSSIEYKYSWNDSKVKQRPFQFNNDYELRTKLIGTAKASLSLKTGGVFEKFELAPISTKRVQEKADYTFLLYFAAGIIFLLLSAIFYSFLKNRRQKIKIKELQNQQLIMEMEQKALQMQMNPHFIFNSLNGVKGMIALGKTKNAKEYITKISGWMRNMLNDARKSKVLLFDEVKNLSLYLDIEKELRGDYFSYQVVNNTSDSSIHIPSMMIQPFIENAIIHAFDGKQNDAKIELTFNQKGRKIQVTIEDNGKGITSKKTSHKSVAMNLIKERLAIWNEKGNLYGVNVINKNEINPSTSGVRIELDLPIIDNK